MSELKSKCCGADVGEAQDESFLNATGGKYPQDINYCKKCGKPCDVEEASPSLHPTDEEIVEKILNFKGKCPDCGDNLELGCKDDLDIQSHCPNCGDWFAILPKVAAAREAEHTHGWCGNHGKLIRYCEDCLKAERARILALVDAEIAEAAKCNDMVADGQLAVLRGLRDKIEKLK